MKKNGKLSDCEFFERFEKAVDKNELIVNNLIEKIRELRQKRKYWLCEHRRKH